MISVLATHYIHCIMSAKYARCIDTATLNTHGIHVCLERQSIKCIM